MRETPSQERIRPNHVPVYACTGETAPARLARELGAQLAGADLRLARGVSAVAVDGCPSACTSRKLEAAGIRPLALTLDELLGPPGADRLEGGEALLGRALERLRAAAPATARAARRRPPPRRAPEAGRRRHTMDDYLHALYLLSSPVVPCGVVASGFPALAAHVARILSVSPPSAGEMLTRMERAGYVGRGGRKELVLTRAGRRAAERVIRRHRVVERFLVDFLGYSAAESHVPALEVAGAFGEDLVERAAALLPPPPACPHGWPFEPAEDERHVQGLVALAALPPGAGGAIVALAEDDAVRLGRVGSLGLRPGARVEVLERLGGFLTVATGGRCWPVERYDAEAVLVREGLGSGRSRAGTSSPALAA